ncbi:DUF3052 family protein [soil metagenome]
MDRDYSQVPIAKKLGIQPDSLIIVINKPAQYELVLGDISTSLTISSQVNKPVEFIHSFATEKKDLIEIFPKLKQILTKTGMLWISWPKKSSKKPTDLDENIVMQIGLENGLVDVKVASFDETWSALKFIYRVKDR